MKNEERRKHAPSLKSRPMILTISESVRAVCKTTSHRARLSRHRARCSRTEPEPRSRLDGARTLAHLEIEGRTTGPGRVPAGAASDGADLRPRGQVVAHANVDRREIA